MDRARENAIAALSREVAAMCARDGTLVWLDPRAERLLGLSVGDNLADRLSPPAAARELFVRASRGRVDDVALESPAVPLLVSAGPFGDHVLLVARIDADRKGIRVLHAELDEKAAALRHATELKTRVVASVSHEFRTPLHTILGLTKLLLDRVDGELTGEQETQVRFVRDAAQTLSNLVDDLLDLSKLDAGKGTLRVQRFEVDDLFRALSTLLRAEVPPGVELVFEQVPTIELETDQAKLSQILRNVLSNALKFTERGTVHIAARADGANVVFTVKDTGIGIAAEYLDTIFDEFAQLESPVQDRVRGTGIGLALSRRLATLLTGRIAVESLPGEGSLFTITVPRVHDDVRAMQILEAQAKQQPDPRRAPVLVVEDDRTTLFLYERYLRDAGYQVLPARTVDDARAMIARTTPAAVILDVMLEGESTWRFLRELKENEETRSIPVMVVTVVDAREKARALGADEFWLKPFDPSRLQAKLAEISRKTGKGTKIVVIDDDDTSRYLIRKLLADSSFAIIEASGAEDGLRLVRAERPQLVLLDFTLQDANVFDIIDELKQDMDTRTIPVVVHTARDLDDAERRRLADRAAAVVPKVSLSREIAIARIREALAGSGIHPVAEMTR